MNFVFNQKLVSRTTVILAIIACLTIVSADSDTSSRSGNVEFANPTQSNGFRIAAITDNADQYTSSVINTDFPFNALGTKWEDPSEKAVIWVRFQKERWGEWQMIENFDEDSKDGTNMNVHSAQLISSPYTNIFQYRITGNISDIKNLSFTYIDSISSAKASYHASADADGLKIISRAEWGANESIRFDETTTEIWPKEYYTPKKFIVHHTASKSETDSFSTVRAIYQWHVKGQEWGDIGYNYLIDPQGRIFEGRAGGDGVVGGHAFMNNRTSIGIAIIGCYQPDNRSCANPDQLSPQTLASLEKLIAVKSQQFNIATPDLAKLSAGQIMEIYGHRDVDQTNCPGDNVYKNLSVIKTDSFAKFAKLAPLEPLPTGATLVSVSRNNIEIPENETGRVIITYKNTGKATWLGYADNHLLVGANVKKLGSIAGVKIAAVNTASVSGFKMTEGNVKPGEIGTFIVDLPAQTGTQTLTLAWDGKGYFPGTDVTITTKKVKAQGAVKIVPIYKASTIEANLPEIMPIDSAQSVNLTFLNDGNVSWSRDLLKLSIALETGIPSPLLTSANLKANEETIEPGSTATFVVNLKSGSTVEMLRHVISLSYDGNRMIGYNYFVTISGPFAGQIVESNIPAAMKAGAKQTVTLKIKNVGTRAWTAPFLKSTDIDGTLSWFYDRSWPAQKTASVTKKTIQPGEVAEFTFKLRAYTKPKTYPQLFKLWAAKQAITINGQEVLELRTRVDK